MPKLTRPNHKMLEVARHLNAGETPERAVELSGYLPGATDKTRARYALKIMGHPLMVTALAEAHARMFDDIVMSRAEALERLTVVARGSFADLIEFRTINVIDNKGNTHKQALWAFKDSDRMTPDDLALIEEIHATPGGGFKVKLRSAGDATKQITKILGWEAPPRGPVDADGKDVPATILLTRTVKEVPTAAELATLEAGE